MLLSRESRKQRTEHRQEKENNGGMDEQKVLAKQTPNPEKYNMVATKKELLDFGKLK